MTESSTIDLTQFPADAIVLLNDVPFVSQLPSDGSADLKWVPLPDYATSPELSENLAVKTKLRMMGAMLLDETRNAAYDEALKLCIQPGDVVLDAGAGTGILSMMAARHGAKKVYACEMNEYFAKIANRVVKDNSLESIIEVVSKRTTDVLPTDLDFPVDVLVSETMDSILTTEGMIQTLRDAKQRLGRPGTRVIPERGQIFGRLIEFKAGSPMFDYYQKQVLNPSRAECLLIHADSTRFRRDSRAISPDRELFELHFTTFSDTPEGSIIEKQIEFDGVIGTVHALLMWWKVDLYGPISISTCPDQTASWQDHWHHALYVFESQGEDVADTKKVNIKLLLDTSTGQIDVERDWQSRERGKRAKRSDEMPMLSLPMDAHHCFMRWVEGPLSRNLHIANDSYVLDLSAAQSPELKKALAITTPTFRSATVRTLALFCPALAPPNMMLLENEADAAMFFLYRCAHKLTSPANDIAVLQEL